MFSPLLALDKSSSARSVLTFVRVGHHRTAGVLVE